MSYGAKASGGQGGDCPLGQFEHIYILNANRTAQKRTIEIPLGDKGAPSRKCTLNDEYLYLIILEGESESALN